MNKFLSVAVLIFVVAVVASPALAQAPVTGQTEAAPLDLRFAALGAGLVIIGAAYGIGQIGSRAVESMSRQPEVAGNIQTAMIISAALIEGATFFGLIVCLIA